MPVLRRHLQLCEAREAAVGAIRSCRPEVVYEAAPDPHGVAAACEVDLDQLAVRGARAGRRHAGRRGPCQRAGDPRRQQGWVGGHLTGRFSGRQLPVARIAHGDARGLEIGAGDFAPHARRLFEAA